MSGKILVTYATRGGSTAGVAEAVGKTLSASGAQVDVLPMTEVRDLAPYKAVIAGSAIQGAKWLPEAMQFVRDHRMELSRTPFATFTVCMTMAMKNEQYRKGVTDWLEPVRALVRPVSEGFFAGELNLSKVPSLRKRLMFRVSILTG
ncbi:MAG TPA: flavodoxin domain-containing protein, partial [Aggregatilineaceae bacterium]|nr:flavodoxin domain-containing protein [Aggregatilineaceae bacterium]